MKKTAPIKRLNYSFRSVNEGCRWLRRLDETHRRLNESKRREKGEQADTSGASWSKKILRDWARGFNEARLYRASVSRLRHNPIFLPRFPARLASVMRAAYLFHPPSCHLDPMVEAITYAKRQRKK